MASISNSVTFLNMSSIGYGSSLKKSVSLSSSRQCTSITASGRPLKASPSVRLIPSNPLRSALFDQRNKSHSPCASKNQVFQVTASAFKVAVLGAGGGIGQPLSLLLKMSPLVSDLRLYDIANVKGVAADLSHCNTPATVSGFTGMSELADSLKDVDLVIIPAGIPRKPGMTRDDLFNINAGIVKALIESVAENAPNALINIISNPVNSTVPIAAEILKSKGVYDPKKLFGVTTLDVVRANTFVAEAKNLKLIDVDVPVVGGHAGITILPLLSKTKPAVQFTQQEIEALTVRIQNAGTEVVEAKAGAGSATLSMAYAAARFAESCLRGLDGDADVFECAYVQSELTELPFFASRVKLGVEGLDGFVTAEFAELSEFEQKAVETLKEELKGSIAKGIAFANKAAEAKDS